MNKHQIQTMYRPNGVDDVLAKINQIKSLARVSACASDTALNVDLEQCGYSGVFEVIHRLSEEVYMDVDDWLDAIRAAR